jgi:hypothetical protein
VKPGQTKIQNVSHLKPIKPNQKKRTAKLAEQLKRKEKRPIQIKGKNDRVAYLFCFKKVILGRLMG